MVIKEQIKELIVNYIEDGYFDINNEEVKNVLRAEASSLKVLKEKLSTQQYAYNNLLSIVDRCEQFDIVGDVLDEPIYLVDESTPSEEVDYTNLYNKMVDAIAKKHARYIKALLFAPTIEREDFEEDVPLYDVEVQDENSFGCGNTLNDETLRNILSDYL